MSIKVGELRLGNKLFCQDELNTLYGITKEGFVQYEKEDGVYYCSLDELKGMPLTDKDVKQYGHFNLIKVNDEYFVCFGNYKTQVKFYHEVQNYYYLVNHEEL